MNSSEEEVLAPKRAPRKRASRAVSKTPPRTTTKRAPKKTTSGSETVRTDERISSSSTERKAPTLIASTEVAKKRQQHQLIIIGVFLVAGIGSSALFGLMDEGQIDVTQTIEARNERIRTNTTDDRDVNKSIVEVPVQNTNNAGKADGGLVGRGTGGKKPKPVVIVATTTATSTDQMASSTDATASSSKDVTDEEDAPSEDEDEDLEPPLVDETLESDDQAISEDS